MRPWRPSSFSQPAPKRCKSSPTSGDAKPRRRAMARGSGSHLPDTDGCTKATGSGSSPPWWSDSRIRRRTHRPGASDRGPSRARRRIDLMAMEPTPIVELGVSEAYEILTGHFGITDLPPLDSLENEDWGRDYLLSRFLELPR